ncbi:MAG: hypothetical protein ACRENZ_09150 [Thermodesulfobacteriota bacterium]
MKKIILSLIIVVLIIVFFVYREEDDSGEVRNLLDELVMAGEEKDLEGIMEHFSSHYSDEYGANYFVVQNVIKNYFERYDGFKGEYSRLRATAKKSEDKVEVLANLDLSVSGIKSGKYFQIIGSEYNPENITVILEKSLLGNLKIRGVEGLSLEEKGF